MAASPRRAPWGQTGRGWGARARASPAILRAAALRTPKGQSPASRPSGWPGLRAVHGAPCASLPSPRRCKQGADAYLWHPQLWFALSPRLEWPRDRPLTPGRGREVLAIGALAPPAAAEKVQHGCLARSRVQGDALPSQREALSAVLRKRGVLCSARDVARFARVQQRSGAGWEGAGRGAARHGPGRRPRAPTASHGRRRRRVRGGAAQSGGCARVLCGAPAGSGVQKAGNAGLGHADGPTPPHTHTQRTLHVPEQE